MEPTREASPAATGDPLLASGKLPLKFLGMGLYLTWIYSVQFGSDSSPSPLTGGVAEPISLIVNLANAAMLIACALLARRIAPLSQKRGVAWVAAGLMGLGTLLLALSPLPGTPFFGTAFGLASDAANILGAAMAGLGLGLIILLWSEFYAALPLRLVIVYYSGSFIVATLLHFIILLASGTVSVLITAALPVASVAFFTASMRTVREQREAFGGEEEPAGAQITFGAFTPPLREEAAQTAPLSGRSHRHAHEFTDEEVSTDAVTSEAAALAARAREEVSSEAQEVSEIRWTFPWQPVILMAAYSFTFSFCRTTGGVVNALPMVGIALIAAFSLVGGLWFFDRFRIKVLYRLALPLMVGGALLQLCLSGNGLVFAGILLNASHASFIILIMVLMSTMCYRYGILAIWLFGITRAARVLASVAGSYLGMTAFHTLGLSNIALATNIIVVVLVALSMFLLTDEAMATTWGITPRKPKSPKPAETPAAAHPADDASGTAEPAVTPPAAPAPVNYFDTFVGRCAQVARTYGLTPREEEVLALLAQGYSVPRVEKKLFISNGTAKSHVRHIYAKMGIHTRDELIQIVDARSCQPPAQG